MAPQQCPGRTGRRAVIAVAAAVFVTLVSGPGFVAAAVSFPDPPTATPADPAPTASAPTPVTPSTESAQPEEATITPVPTAPSGSVLPTPFGSVPPMSSAPGPTIAPPAKESPAFGAFLGSGADGVTRMEEFSDWLGGADLRVGHTYLPGDSWSNIEGASEVLDPWARWRKDRDDRMLVLNVPLQERNEHPVSDAQVRLLLRQGAAGEFDHHFRALAEKLVALNVPDTILVLGWEMNGTTYAHRCGPDPEAWKTYWNRVVTTMRSVPGQQFRFDFTPSRGRDAVPWTRCYPGDDTVDIIGMDTYDQPEGLSFAEQITEPYGLQAHVDFAKLHNKPISYAEWGLFRNGDNAVYMLGMLAWIAMHKPVYNTLTDYCPHGVWQCAANPVSSRIYRAILSARTEGPAEPEVPVMPEVPVTQPTPNPSTPTVTQRRPARCSPLHLGDRVEHWLGGKLCLRLEWWSRTR
ncbi:glycosyl hydrolase [Streptomyces cellulosae]|uniref:glycosyl hydrolase n=1 Tax=Streptomyces cellulosae TaxID=1968 RepID=UPI0004C9AFE8|nr:glycosyl hydrolase [Streptomyces cellulosae]